MTSVTEFFFSMYLRVRYTCSLAYCIQVKMSVLNNRVSDPDPDPHGPLPQYPQDPDPDPHEDFCPDPDPQKNADPKPCKKQLLASTFTLSLAKKNIEALYSLKVLCIDQGYLSY